MQCSAPFPIRSPVALLPPFLQVTLFAYDAYSLGPERGAGVGAKNRTVGQVSGRLRTDGRFAQLDCLRAP